MKTNWLKAVVVIGILLWLTGCSSTPEEVALEQNEKVINKDICVYPDGGFIEAPEWICAEKGPLEAVGQYSIKGAGYQHARNMAFTQASREIAATVQSEIRSMMKSYTGVTGEEGKTVADHQDEDVIKVLTFQTLKGAHIQDYVISPNKDLYVFVSVKDIPDMPSGIDNRGAMMWQQFKASQAHKELDKEYSDYVKSQNPALTSAATQQTPEVQVGSADLPLDQVLQDAKRDPQDY